jgi:hypothetical protein
MSLEIVTYANKSQGMFEDLVKNTFGVPIKVLGWGTKWNGFNDKYRGMSEYLKTKRDTDIVIFLDGFDTKINKDPRDVMKLFEKCDCKVLVSKGPNPGDHLLGTCKAGIPANSGMYMGYVKFLKVMIDDALSYTCEDDQVNLNMVCKKYPFIKVDDTQLIFENVSQLRSDKESNALFVSYPGKISFDRISRGFFEYTQFVYVYVLCLLVLSMGIFPKHSNVLLSLLVGLVLFYILFADKSCTSK